MDERKEIGFIILTCIELDAILLVRANGAAPPWHVEVISLRSALGCYPKLQAPEGWTSI